MKTNTANQTQPLQAGSCLPRLVGLALATATVAFAQAAEDGVFIGQVARVPYTADYFFYRKASN